MRLLKQSTARNVLVFMTDSADHIAGKTGLTLTITASKDGASFASITPTVTELATGWYSLALTTSHTDTLGDLALHITSTGADPTDLVAQVVVDLPGTTNSDIAAIKAKTDNLPTDPADASDIAAEFSSLNTKVDTIDDFLDTEIAAIKAKTDNLPASPAAVSDIPTVQNIVDGVWDETMASHVGAGSTGAALNAAGAAGDPWSTTLPGAYGAGTAGNILGNNLDAAVTSRASQTSVDDIQTDIDAIELLIDTEIAAIKAKTDNLPSDPADASDIAAEFVTVNSTLSTIASYIDTEVAAIKAKTDNLPADPADASDIASAFSAIDAKIDVIDDFLDTEVAAIKAKTDALPSDPADASDIASAFSTVNSTLTTIAGYIDTEVAAIKAKTDNLPADPASQTDVTTVGADVTLIKAVTDNFRIKKNSALSDFEFPMTDSTNHDPDTGLTVTVQISKDGGAFTNSANAVAEVGSGIYKINLDAAELNANVVTLKMTATGADTRFVTIITQG